MRLRSVTFRQGVIAVFAAVGIGLLPWTIWLATSLQAVHVTDSWDLAWSGFDIGLALLFIATAIAAYRRSPWVGALAAALGTMLIVDAWFDIVLASHTDERRTAIVFAVFLELPTAVVCFWIAQRTERFLRHVMAQAEQLHLPATRESPSESDLVGVLEVAADGKPAREPGDADAAA
jgi:hypothetical protein